VSRFVAIVLLPVFLFSAPPPVTVVRDVSVVDVVNGQIAPHRDIVLRGGIIAAVRQSQTRGRVTRFVIPGLWDMDVHLSTSQPDFPRFIAQGVTGIRDIGTELKQVHAWQAGIAKGSVAGPRIFASGTVVSTATANTPDDARRAFNRSYDQRVDFISILDLSEPAFEALAEASRHAGLAFAGPVPDSVSAFAAAQDRMVSMEHLFGIALACSSQQNEFRNKLLAAKAVNDSEAILKINSGILETYDRTAAQSLFDLFRRYEVRQIPTLAVWNTDRDPGQREFAFKLTGDMAKAGVAILAGTGISGVTVQDELGLLVEAGLTPLQALRAATYEPARLMHKESTLGQIGKGYLADLLVLDANPLTDIGNTRKIDAVIVRGKQFDKAALKRML
jgi:hypothetical protein